MSTVCFDTNIIINAIQENELEENIVKTKLLIHDCKVRKINIIIPSLVIAEILMGLEQEKISFFCSDIGKLAMIVPFDIKAALEYGKISRVKWTKRQDLDIPRNKMKIDMLIIATAIANKAECIYSEDEGLMRVADGFIETRKLPGYRHQTEIGLQL